MSQNSRTKKIAWLLLKIGFTATLLYFFFRNTKLENILASVSSLSIGFYIFLTAMNVTGVAVNAYKWNMFIKEHSFINLLKLNFVSYYFSLLLPGQIAGEAAKAYILGRNNGAQMQRIAASVIIDKVTAVIGLLLVGLFGLVMSVKELPLSIVISFAVCTTIALTALFFIRIDAFYKLIIRIFKYVENKFTRLKKIVQIIIEIVDSWHAYAGDVWLIIKNILLGVVFQLIGVSIYYLLSAQLGINVGFYDWCWIVGALTVAMLLPITVGGIGVREGALVGLLGLFNCSNEMALTLSLISFSFLVVAALIGTIIYYTLKLPKDNINIENTENLISKE